MINCFAGFSFVYLSKSRLYQKLSNFCTVSSAGNNLDVVKILFLTVVSIHVVPHTMYCPYATFELSFALILSYVPKAELSAGSRSSGTD